MGLSAYLSQSQYFADELLDLLTEQELEAAGALFDQHSYDLVVQIPADEREELFAFLGKPPSDQERQFAQLTGNARLTFWLRARYLAFATADALSVAYVAEMHLKASYRGMQQAIAQAVHPYPKLPSKADLLWRRIR